MKQITLLIISWLLMSSSVAMAQRNIEIVVPYGTGGTADRISQTLLPHLRAHLQPHGLNPILLYKPGAGSMIGSAAVARTDADDLRLLIVGNSLITAQLTTQRNDAYDLQKDFHLVYYLGHIPMLMVVNTKSGLANIQHFRAECQKKTMSYGSAGVGSATHLSAHIVSRMLGCKTLHVPYKGVGAAITDLHGRHIDFVVDFVTSITPHIGIKGFTPILAISSQRNTDFPTVTSLREITNQDYNFYNWFILAANSSANAADKRLLSTIAQNLDNDAAWKKSLQQLFLDQSTANLPQNFLSSEAQIFADIIRPVLDDAK